MNISDDDSVDKEYPKILIVSRNALSLHTNNGKTLHSLFKDWPVEAIAQLYFQDEKPESDKFQNFFRLRDIDIGKVLIGVINRNDCGDVLKAAQYLGSRQVDQSRIKCIVKKVLKDYLHVHIIFRDLIFGTNLWRSKRMIEWVFAFRPNAIFFMGGDSSFLFKIVMWLSSAFKIPFYIYLTDDYVVNNHPGNAVERLQHRALIKCYRNAFNRARGLFVIGTMMAQDFEKYFGKVFHPVMNSIDFSNKVRPCTRINDKSFIHLVYAGGLSLGRWRMLLEFG